MNITDITRRSRASRIRQRRGATAFEFAFAAPLLMLIIFGTFEITRLSLIRNMSVDAAYEACRSCMVEGATRSEAIARANEVLALVGTRGAIIEVNDGEDFTSSTKTIKTTISVPMDQNAFIMKPFFVNRFVNAEISMNMERYSGFFDGSR